MLEYIDFRYDWDKSEIIVCMRNCDTGKHFYIREKIESVQEALEIVSFWEMYAIMFIDPTFQHPN